MGWIKDFFSGVKGDFPPLEIALQDERMNARYRLVDIDKDGVHYDSTHQTIAVDFPDDNDDRKNVILVNPQFADYVKKYVDEVHIFTRHGTPWLTDEERKNPAQVADYYRALKSGPKADIAVINWRKTNAAIKDTGHAALAVAHLNFEDEGAKVTPDRIGPDGNLLPQTETVDDILTTQAGSYYPFASKWIDRNSIDEHLAAAKKRVVVEDSPEAHAAGLVARNTARPAGIAAGTALAGTAIAAKYAGKKGALPRKIAGLAASFTAAAGAAYGLGRAASILQKSPGAVLMKEEEKGHGILATLITPAQRDIFECTMYGLNKTYFKEYSILNHNCADFCEHMFQEIGLNTHHMVDRAMKTEPQFKDIVRRAAKSATIPSHIRPDRHQWATRKAISEGRDIETGAIEIDGEELLVRKMNITGQSSLLIEAEEQRMFEDRPLETLTKILQNAVVVEPHEGLKTANTFGFTPNVEIVNAQTRTK